MKRDRRMQQHELPFLHALTGYLEDGVIPFHTPGHKQGRGIHNALRKYLEGAAQLDVSDVVASERFDDSWTEALYAAERLAAEAFGAKRTYFAVNGTSGAIHTMLLAVRSMGYEEIVVPRESHLSVFGGLILSGLRPRYVTGSRLSDWNLSLPPAPSAYETVLATKAVYMATRPSYYGIAQPLEALADLAHAREGLLLVDEAHGPHFGFHRHLPAPALWCGADLVAQSTHKVLGAFTQSSMLHIGSSRVLEHLVERALLSTASTSPSGLLFASLDAARAQMVTEGAALWEKAFELADMLRQHIQNHLGVTVLSPAHLPAGYELDRTRLVIRTADRGLHGVEAADKLRRHGVQVELADPWHVVALLTWADTRETANALLDALRSSLDEPERVRDIPAASVWDMPAPTVRLTPRQAALSPTEWVPLREAVGRISAETICPYPPGIPVLCPGEEIDADIIAYLEGLRHTAFEVRGACDPTLQQVLVVRT